MHVCFYNHVLARIRWSSCVGESPTQTVQTLSSYELYTHMPASVMDEDKAVKLATDVAVRSEELRVAAIQAKIAHAVKVKPAKARQLWDLMATIGITDNTYKVPEPLEQISKCKSAQLTRKETIKAQRVKAKTEGQEMAAAAGARDPIPAAATNISKLTVPCLRKVLAMVAPVVLSMSNLMHHQRTLGRPGLVQCLTFLTGCSPDEVLFPKVLCFRVLAERLRRDAAARGDRASKIKLPLDWETAGVYRVSKVEASAAHILH
eukprot:6477564-Amphidinium_carterae.1